MCNLQKQNGKPRTGFIWLRTGANSSLWIPLHIWNFLTNCGTISFSGQTLLHVVIYLVRCRSDSCQDRP
jgi:hypothetical protein